ncbi:paraquat-inducible protein A [uncultured Shewanella sp.]|uniref:paraquat-inducible protein A n=1 Tax=uncultured Shewanella sp. TaxID=173975 RepID=UPI002618A790|nr:paraquat-inducible protein A [uncultured Shewanella sp.]
MKQVVSILVIVLSLVLLIPGVTQPILSIQGSIEKTALRDAGLDMIAQQMGEDSQSSARGMLSMVTGLLGLNDVKGEVEVFQKTRSIWGTSEELYHSGNKLVAVLIILFSVFIPVVKLLLMLLMSLPIKESFSISLNRFIGVIGKWSMADVFIVAIIVSYMAGNASAGMGDLLKTTAQFEVGFYYFLGYCLFSLLSHGFLSMKRS